MNPNIRNSIPAMFVVLITITLYLIAAPRSSAQAAGPTTQPASERAKFVGAVRCAECHKDYYDSWRNSAHNKMIRRPTTAGPEPTVLADFSKADPNRPFELKDVKWVIGHRWKQRFIGEVNGREVVYPAQWSIAAKKWMPYMPKAEWWYPRHVDWKTRSNFRLCAGCHSTGLDPVTESWAETNISCEACHGPGKAHADKPTIDNIVNPSRLSVELSMDICLSCHQAGRPPDEQYAWPVGFSPGEVLAEYWHGFEPEKGKQTNEFWASGTAHKNRVQGNTFVQSVMHERGLQCSNCHDAHGSRNRSMTIKSAETNALCLTCHGPGKRIGPRYKSITEHSHHAPTSTGSQCIACHMPRTGENAIENESRNHTFDFISPEVSRDGKSPNSCNTCHADKSVQWAIDSVKTWYPGLTKN